MIRWLVIGLMLIGSLSYWCRLQARRQIEESQRLSVTTVVGVWIVYLGHAALTVFSAVLSIWSLPWPRLMSLWLGCTAIALGAILLVLGMMTFRSFQRMNGRLNDRLITSGIYRWSRNPQNVGWGLALFGIAVAGRSAVALILTVVFWVRFGLYVREEERQLETSFGEEYCDYLATSHRYFGPPRPTAA
ncbi:isoprenylcysteine carboxylmethyltransferase family protein [Acidobacteria bacterium AH-259-L09]|nr:isoprenylcysteine carboxylmethyltransferase family protein [Acidobacteria bacterium AH-259-L09]